MIVLCTDFGLAGPYIGQMKAIIWQAAPAVPIIDLFADLPPFDARSAAYLLAAYAEVFPAETVFLCVVDPGVGSDRAPLAVRADSRWFVGPDNGLFELVARRSPAAPAWFRLALPSDPPSASFHGRDVFAPAAVRLACGLPLLAECNEFSGTRFGDWPDDLRRVVYVDHFGNAITGCRAETFPRNAAIFACGHKIMYARTFSEVQKGQAFWYENANGLLEIAVNQGRADSILGLAVGSLIEIDATVNGYAVPGEQTANSRPGEAC